MDRSRCKKAFTLIELSIVLVIIGLLAGGILVGRELIHNAEVYRQVKQIQDYQSAFNTFRAKYKCIPGDCANATDFFGTADPVGGIIANGNGDGFIDTNMGYGFDPDTDNTWSASTEISGVIRELAAANLVNFKPTSLNSPPVAGKDLPGFVLNKNATFFIGAHYNFVDAWVEGAPGPPVNLLTSYEKGNNAIWMVACHLTDDSMGYWNDSCGIFMPLDLRNIDIKIDDGKALSGNLMGFGGDVSSNADCLASADYKSIKTTNECQAVLVIN